MIKPTRSVRPGDREESCDHCHYFTGHTDWCRMGKAEAAAVEAAVASGPVRRVNLYTNTEGVVGKVIRAEVHVFLGRGEWVRRYRYGIIDKVVNGRTVVRFPGTEGGWTYGPSGRVSVRG